MVVPVMGIAYIGISLLVVIINIQNVPAMFVRIFEEAFDFKAIFGAFSGSAIMQGVRRGLFSNEAGMGSAPNAAATATVSHPVKQGLVQMLSVFIDTLLLCTATAMMCMSSGIDPAKELQGAPWVQASLQESLGSFGPIFITVAMVFFAFTTILGWDYYGERCLEYLFNKNMKAVRAYRWLYIICVFIGPYMTVAAVWNIADIFNALMAIPNLIALLALSKVIVKETKAFTEKLNVEEKNQRILKGMNVENV